jgi:hypothetical protein
MRKAAFFAFSAALLAAAPLAAQEQESPKGSDIIVSGDADYGWEEVIRQARSISRETDIRHKPLARFEDPICPGVIGMKREAAEMIVGRLRQIAEELDIEQAEAGACNPNVIIAFTEDGQANLAAVQKRSKMLSDWLTVSERRELLEEPGPVRVLSIVETRMLNGMPVARGQNLVDVPIAAMNAAHSRIYTATRRDIVAVAVLFDRNEMSGLTHLQLADYAAMRVFARTREPSKASDVDSILSLFDARDGAPQGLTPFDVAYLESLYAGIANIPGSAKIAGVEGKLRRPEEAQE